MNSPLPVLESTHYQLSEDLRGPMSPTVVHHIAPNESAHEELLLEKLGPRGWGRVCLFRDYYGPDWGDAHGKQLSPRALDAFFQFLEQIDFPSQGKLPSVFLTDRGGIELSWEDEKGLSVQVEFTSTFAEYFCAATNSEGKVSFNELPALAQKLA